MRLRMKRPSKISTSTITIVFAFFFRGRRRGCTGSSSRNVAVIRVRFATSAIYVSESVIREFPFQRCYINYVSSILNLFPFPIYVGNRECPEGNQIDAGQ